MTICIKINQSYAKLHTPTAASSSQAQVIGYRWVILQKACWSDPLYYVKKIHWGWQGKIKSNTNMYKNINTIIDFDICDVVVLKVYFKYDWNYSVIDIYIYIHACIVFKYQKISPITCWGTSTIHSKIHYRGCINVTLSWRALAGKMQVTDIITRTNTLTHSQGHLNTMVFGINWFPFWRAPERTSSWLTASFWGASHAFSNASCVFRWCEWHWWSNEFQVKLRIFRFTVTIECLEDRSKT